ncbi:MAG: DUF1292 domain-containing protein [Clostridia bacterium]|nr:DUF1292 domain-containing protein [Clostridia bacterium]
MSDDKLNIDDLNLFGDQEETYEVVSMVDDDGKETDFFVMDGIDIGKQRYLLLVRTEDFDLDEPEAFIFKEINVTEDECTYEIVDDEKEYNKVLLLLQDEDSEYEMKF